MKNSMMLFFDMMFFLDNISVNQFFLKNRVKKIMTLVFLAWSEIRVCTLLTSCQKMHHPSVNRFNGLILWYVFDYQNKSGDDATNL